MLIQLKKKTATEGTLTCVRVDGTRTWWKLTEYFGAHDLIHFVVESALGYEDAFFGLIASGWEQDWFGQVDPQTGRNRAIPLHADYAENIVMLVQAELFSSQPEADFYDLLPLAFDAQGIPPPVVTPEQLAHIRGEIRFLLREWKRIPPGHTLEVRFAPQNSTMLVAQ